MAASLAANRPAKWIAGTRRRVQYAISPVGEDPVQEAIAVTLDRCHDAMDVRGVDAETDNLRHAAREHHTAVVRCAKRKRPLTSQLVSGRSRGGATPLAMLDWPPAASLIHTTRVSIYNPADRGIEDSRRRGTRVF